MNKRPSSLLSSPLNRVAFKIAGIYLLMGILWILFSDRLAERIALNKEILTSLSLYKGWGFVIVTAFLLYWLIQRYTSRLNASEKQLQVVINALPVLISYIDKNQHYQYANESYEEWFGEKAQGKHIEEVVGQVIYQKTSKYIDKVLSGENVTYETAIPFRDGSERFVSATYISDIAENGQVKGFFTLVQDISEQKEAREELRQWAAAFEGCAHGIAIGDPDTNRIVVCNPAFANMHKCRVEDIVGTSILSLYSPSDHEHVRHNIERADQIGHVRFEAQMTRKGGDNSVFPVQMDLVSVLDEAGELIHRVVTAQDISERKQGEEKIVDQARLLEQVNDAVIATDEHFIVTSWNAGAEHIFGWQANEIIGRKTEEILQTEFFSKTRPDAIQEIKERGEFSAEIIQSRKDGSRIPIEARTVAVRDERENITGYVSINRDITERKHTEEKLRKSEERYRYLFENNPHPMWVYDRKTLAFLDVNEAAIAKYGYSRQEFLKMTIVDIRPPEDVDRLIKNLAQPRQPLEHSDGWKHLLKGGAIIDVEITSHTIEIDGHESALVVAVDITERRKAEEYLRRFELLSEHSRDIILFIDRKDGHILETNAAAMQAYGYSREELLALTIRDLRAGGTQELTSEQMAQADAGGILFETIHQRKDGTTFPVEVSSQGATIGGVRTLISVARDITERKQVEQALQSSQEQLLLMIKQAPISIAMFDREMRYIVASQRWVAEYGRGYTDLVGRSHYEIHPDIPERWKEAHRRGLAGESLRNDNDVWTWADGTKNWLRWAIVPWHDSQGEIAGIIISAEDITEGKRAEEELRLKDELLRLTSEMAKVGGWEFDAKSGKGTWTDEVARIHDLDPAQETSVEIGLSFYPGVSREKVEQAVQEAIEFSRAYDLELEMVTAKGKHKWIRTMGLPVTNDGRVVKVQGIFQDITERKQIEEDLQKAHDELELKVEERTAALSQANALLQALMDTMPDQIYFKDMQSRFIRNSRSQASLLGLSEPAQVVGKTDFDFFPHAAKAYAEEQEVMQSGKPLVDFEEWVVWPDGSESWVSTTKVPLRSPDGETIGIFGISRDITERKRAEQAIQQLNRDLEDQAAKLQVANKELEAFSYSVSHDLRAPLRAIHGYTRILVEDYEANLDAEGKRVCSVISAEARRMGQLIDDLLAFSRLGRKEMYSSTIDMKALVVSALNELLKEEDRARIDFHIARLPSTRADSSLMRQVWVNLLSNAIKFTSKKERAVIEVGSKSSKEEIVYYVRDTGAGFDMEYANKLFGVFQRLHGESEFEGTGVGLAIVQRIIRRHGGRVWAEGEMDKGATFYFALPRKENDHE